LRPRGINESVTAPLPDLGLLAYYKLGYGVTLGARAQYFQLKIDKTEGRLLDLRGEAIKYLDQDHHWAIGAAYQFYGVDVDHKADNATLDVAVKYHGPSLFLQYDF